MPRFLSSHASRLMSKGCVRHKKQRLFYGNAADFAEICTIVGREAKSDFL